MPIISIGLFRLRERSGLASNKRFALVAVAMTMTVALAVLSRNDQSSRMQVSADSVATPPAPVKRGPAHVTSPAGHAFASEAADASNLLPSLSFEDLVNAQNKATRDEQELVVADALAGMVEIDGKAAARSAELVNEPHLREVALRVVAQRWAHLNPATAISWAASLGDTNERDQAILNVALELAQTDPPRAVRLLERQFTAGVPDGVLEGVLQQWAEKSYEDALAWSATLPPGARRDLVLQRLVFVRANQDPLDAARLAEEAFADNDKRADALASIALSWGSRDPILAREWARSLAGHARERVDAELALLAGTDM